MSLDKLGGTTERQLQFILEILESILTELKTMNRHLGVMTDEESDHDSDP